MGQWIKGIASGIKDGISHLRSWLKQLKCKFINAIDGVIIYVEGLARKIQSTFFKYQKKPRQVFQARRSSFQEQDVQRMEWQPLPVENRQMQVVESFVNLHQFNQSADRLLCPIKKKVISRPAQVTCCGKIYDYACIRNYVAIHHMCQSCKRPINPAEINDQSAEVMEKKDAIIGFRFRIRNTYKELRSDEQRKEWEQGIDTKMGTEYLFTLRNL